MLGLGCRVLEGLMLTTDRGPPTSALADALVRAMNGSAQRMASKAKAAKGAERRANTKRALCCWRLPPGIRVGGGVWGIRAGELLFKSGRQSAKGRQENLSDECYRVFSTKGEEVGRSAKGCRT